MNIHERNLILNFKKHARKAKREDPGLANCTFYPQLNPKSLKMAQGKPYLQVLAMPSPPQEYASKDTDKLFRQHLLESEAKAIQRQALVQRLEAPE